MIVSIVLNTNNLTNVYCYSNDLQYAAILSQSEIPESIESFPYQNITAFLETENWKQPQDTTNGS
jgi:hypothetical protein